MSIRNLILASGACLALIACGSGNDASDASRGEGRETASGTFGDGESGGSYSVREDGDETILTVETDGGSGGVKMQSGGEAGGYLPDFAPLYPDAKITPDIAGPAARMMGGLGGAFSQNMGIEGEGFDGGMVSFTSDDDADEIVEFYKDRADDGGLKMENDMNAGGMRVFAANDAATGRSLQVMVFPGQGNDGNQVMLIAGRVMP